MIVQSLKPVVGQEVQRLRGARHRAEAGGGERGAPSRLPRGLQGARRQTKASTPSPPRSQAEAVAPAAAVGRLLVRRAWRTLWGTWRGARGSLWRIEGADLVTAVVEQPVKSAHGAVGVPRY